MMETASGECRLTEKCPLIKESKLNMNILEMQVIWCSCLPRQTLLPKHWLQFCVASPQYISKQRGLCTGMDLDWALLATWSKRPN